MRKLRFHILPTLLLAFALMLPFALAQAAAAPRCEGVFLNTPPSLFLVDLSDKKADDFLDQAFANLLKKGQLKASRGIVQEIAERGTDSLSSDEIATLKNSRKYAAILRSTLQIASEDHKSPADFEGFVKDFGTLNDLIAAKKSSKAQELAEDLLEGYYRKNDIQDLQNEVDGASRKSMRKYFESLHEEVEEVLVQRKVSLGDYHEVRKILKEFLSYYQLAEQVYGPNRFVAEYQYLYDLNESLGKLNDEFTANILDKTMDKYKTKIKFPTELRDQVEYFLDHCQMLSN